MRRTKLALCIAVCASTLAAFFGCDQLGTGDGEPSETTTPAATPTPEATAEPGVYRDDGFGTDNYTQTVVGASRSKCHDVAAQPDGKLVLAGSAFVSGNSDDFALARYNADGTLDSSFGVGGTVTLDMYGESDTGMAVGLQSDGKIVVAGKISREEGEYTLDYFGVARFNSDGTTDASFGPDGDGKVYFSAGSSILDSDLCKDMAILGDDSILVCGSVMFISENTGYDVALAKLTPSGALDASFGSGGRVVRDLGTRRHELVARMDVAGDGRIAVCGGSKSQTSTAVDEFVAVFTSSGALDAGFNGTGSYSINYGNEDVADAVDFQADGKLLLLGTADDAALPEIVLHRFTTAGSLDAAFGSSGTVRVGLSGTANGARAVMALAGGKILVVGDTYVDSEMQTTYLVARYDGNGSLDTGFAVDGMDRTVYYSSDIYAQSAAVAGDGAYVVAGYKDMGNTKYGFCAARYLP